MVKNPTELAQELAYRARYEKKGSFIYCPATGVTRYCILRLSDEACEMFTPFRSGGEEPDGQSRTEWI